MINKKYKLPKEFTKEWLTALRSGEYKQANGRLYNVQNGGYCCIGVAARIKYPLHFLKNENGVYGDVLRGNDTFSDSITKFNLNKIPQELKGSGEENQLVQQLVDLNDTKEYSFEKIADWVEDNVELYD